MLSCQQQGGCPKAEGGGREGGREEAEGGGKEVRESKIGEVLNKLYR